MALQIGRAFQDGIDEFLSERGAVFAGAFVVLGLVNGVIWASLSQGLVELFLGSLPSDAPAQPATGGPAPLAVDVPIAAAAVGAVVLFVANEALNIVAIRAFASDATDPIPSDAGRRLGRTVAVALAASVLTAIAVGIGLVLLVVPGLVCALLFFFVRQEIALNDSGVIESISNSLGIVRDNFRPVAVLFVVLGAAGLGMGLGFGLLPAGLSPIVSTTVSTVLSSVFGVFGIAVTTVAYLHATESDRDGVYGTGSVDRL